MSTTPGCSWTPISNTSWIAVSGDSPRSGSGAFNASVSGNAAASSRNGSFAVAGTTVGVTQAAAEAPVSARLRISAKGLSFHGGTGGSAPAQMLRLRSAPGVASLTASSPNASWLSANASPQNGTWQISVAANAQGLAEGVYDAALLLDCGGAVCDPGSIPVRFTVRNSDGFGPRIASGGVVNAASFQQGIAPGSWVSIFGTNLSTSTRSWRPADFQGKTMPRNLDGVQVFVGGAAAAVQFIGPGQVNFQAPSNLAGGWVQVELRTQRGSDFAYVYSTREFPGFFAFDS